MSEFNFLLRTLSLIYKRPEMYGGYVEHVESVVEHIFHISNTIADSDWVYEATILEFQNLKGQENIIDDAPSIESETIRKLKWGSYEDHVRKSVLEVYSEIWQQMILIPHAYYTGKWIEYLLTDPPFLRSPNEVDLILNVLFRIALQEKYREFVATYTDKVYKLRGSASIGLRDWKIQFDEQTINSLLEEKQTFEKLKIVILKLIGVLEARTGLFE